MKILVADPIAEIGITMLRQYAEVDVKLGPSPEQLKQIIGGYNALVVRSQTKVTADIINSATKMQVIGRAGVGVDNIDVDAATKQGIIVVNAPEGNIISTAEHTISMILSLSRQIPKADKLLRQGVWAKHLKGTEIRSKILGIIGLGRVGTEVSRLARGLRMEVIAYDPMISEERASRLGVNLVELDKLLVESDFITIHIPLNPSNKGLIGMKEIKQMKPTAMIINCARGGIVDEEALYEALEKKIIAGAAVDVFSKEPALDNILLKSENIVVTPHLAASTAEAEVTCSIDIADQVLSVLKGQPAKYSVNAPMFPTEFVSTLGPYLNVGRIIGTIAAQLIRGHPKFIALTYEGEIAKENTTPIKAAALSGLLETSAEERVTIVNADIVAKNRGLHVTEEKDTTCENYVNMLSVKVTTTSGSAKVSGTSLRGKIYLTQVNDYWLEIEPSSRYMLFTDHKDRPGMIGAVGTIMGDNRINISQMQVSQGIQVGNKALMVICFDDPLSKDCYQRISAIPDMYSAVIVALVK